MTMTWAAAVEVLERTTDPERRGGTSLDRDMLDLVLAVGDRLDDGEELTDGEPEAIKVVLGFLHARLERVERDVIRHLKFDSETARTWEEVAAEFGGLYGGRSAIFNRWTRLKDADRRTTSMDMRRGAAIPRDQRDAVVDTETDPDQTDLLNTGPGDQ